MIAQFKPIVKSDTITSKSNSDMTQPITQFYQFQCITHLHAGSGDSNYGVIDKLVQRDPSDDLPCVFASGMKGALREYCEQMVYGGNELQLLSGKVFESSNSKGEAGERGTHIFHDALLLGLPVRSNQRPYFMATSPLTLKKLVDFAELFSYSLPSALVSEIQPLLSQSYCQKGKVYIFGHKNSDIRIEDYDAAHIIPKEESVAEIEGFLDGSLAVFHEEDFRDLCSDYSLPIVARNYLENGKSKNLWYEQIVPRGAVFFFVTTAYHSEDALKAHIDGKLVQIGGNASVGYGQCKIKAI